MKVVVRIAFLIAGLLLWVSDARSQSADVFPKDGIRVEQRLARQTSIRNFRRDIEAFKRSKKRAMRVFLQEKAQEIQSLRSSSSARKVSLRRALDLNRDGRITRGEQLSGRNLIKALRREDRSLWVSLREKHRRMFLAFREEKKKEYRDIRKRFDQAADVQEFSNS
jgi:hypothetical protein